MVDPSDVERAAARIAPFATRTPVMRSRTLDAWAGARVVVKGEHLQRTGSFKYRGATNAVQSLDESAAARGVAAHSSGNHAAALATAAATRGIRAYVVMPRHASEAKKAAAARAGAEIVLCDDTMEARRDVLAGVVHRTGAVEIHPFDDERVIAGAGTAAYELLAHEPELDVLVVPIGGGGLASPTCLAAAALAPHVRVIGVSPSDRATTVADGLRAGCSERTNAILDARGVERVTVYEAAVVAAMRTVWQRTKQVIEPSAAVAFAGVRALALGDATAGVIASGGNVDLDALPWVEPLSDP